MFAPRRDRDAILGDLAEDFATRLVPKYGVRAARLRYWTQVLRSIWPVLRPRLVELAGVSVLVRAARAWLSSSH